MTVLRCAGLTKSFGATAVLRGVNLELAAGTVSALTGDNGSGKSTLLRVLGTAMRPDAGELHVAGVDARRQALQARARLGYVGHDSMLDGVLTMRENLRFFAGLYGVKDADAAVSAMIDRLQSNAFADAPLSELSRGQEQAAAIGRALIHRPALLLLDEPSTGLDADSQARLAQLMQDEARQGTCVLFSTHDNALLPVAQKTYRLSDGRL